MQPTPAQQFRAILFHLPAVGLLFFFWMPTAHQPLHKCHCSQLPLFPLFYWWLSFLLFSIFISPAAAAAKLLQSCSTLCDPIDGSPLGSPVPGILQARTLEWVAISFSNAWKWKVKVNSLSRVRLLPTPWTAAYQAPLSTGFSRQEYWSGMPLPSPLYLLLFCKKKMSSFIGASLSSLHHHTSGFSTCSSLVILSSRSHRPKPPPELFRFVLLVESEVPRRLFSTQRIYSCIFYTHVAINMKF